MLPGKLLGDLDESTSVSQSHVSEQDGLGGHLIQLTYFAEAEA